MHCFLHKIHLVVTFVMQNLDEVNENFSIIAALYKFSKKSAVLESYVGTALKRLTETRWSGHFESTNHVNKNYGDVIQALFVTSRNKNLTSEDRVLANGDNEGDPIFLFINYMLMDVLKPIDIVVKQLQSSEENFISAQEVGNGVKDDINSKRENITSENVKKMTATQTQEEQRSSF